MTSGRNVCAYWLLGECRSGDERCAYAHEKTYLPPQGWWTNTRRLARMCKEFDEAVAASPRLGVSESILAEALKPFPWRKDAWTGGDYAEQATHRAEQIRADAGEEELEPWEQEMEERGMYGGHTRADFNDMLMYGIKPFEFDALVRIILRTCVSGHGLVLTCVFQDELQAVRRALDSD